MPPSKYSRLPDNVIESMLDGMDDDLDSDGDDDLYELYGSDCDDQSDSDEEIVVPGTTGNEDLAPEMMNNDIELENVDEPEVARGERQRKRHKRVINSLDAALKLENYDAFISPTADEVKEYKAVLEKAKRNTPAKEINWTNQKPSVTGRQRRSDVMRSTPGLIGKAATEALETPLDAFKLFFDDEILAHIVECTNIKITDDIIAAIVAERDTSKGNHIFEIDLIELRAYLGLLLYRGLAGQSKLRARYIFQDDFGNPVFGATMSRHRFSYIHAKITFEDQTVKENNYNSDKFAAFRTVYEKFNKHCHEYLVPDDLLAIDETLYPLRTRVSFKQYNPSKPARYGLLFKSINGVRYPYTFVTTVNSGKPESGAGEYYIPHVIDITQNMVETLDDAVDISGRNISFDRLYTSLPLAEWLLDRGISCLGTLMANKRFIPAEVKDTTDREENSTEIFYEKGKKVLVLISYVVKTKSKGKKNVLALTTLRPLLGVTKDDGKVKPAILKLYDHTKGGTDIIDQRIGSYTVKTKSKRWTIAAFAYVIDTARVNAGTLYAMKHDTNPRSLNSFQFGLDLAKSLVLPQLLRRNGSPGLQGNIVRKIALCLGSFRQETVAADVVEVDLQVDEGVEQQAPRAVQRAGVVKFLSSSDDKLRCTLCLDQISGVDYKKNKNKMSKLNRRCQNCNSAICAKHTYFACAACSHKFVVKVNDDNQNML